jgi:excisionase family DNA binding protein
MIRLNTSEVIAQIMTTRYTVPEIAKFLRVSPETVRGWIESGELEASNLSTSSRPRYSISAADFLSFEESRKGKKAPSSSRKVTQYH